MIGDIFSAFLTGPKLSINVTLFVLNLSQVRLLVSDAVVCVHDTGEDVWFQWCSHLRLPSLNRAQTANSASLQVAANYIHGRSFPLLSHLIFGPYHSLTTPNSTTSKSV